jgi:hypothetical protein
MGIIRFFDKLEDRIRGWLSHYPILYALIGGVGIVLFWRGVWHTTDFLMVWLNNLRFGASSISLAEAAWWDGPLSLSAGAVILLMTGVFVTNFIGNEIIISGLRGEKKLAEKTEREVKTEVGAIAEIRADMDKLSANVSRLTDELGKSRGEKK